jgi:hypothetical protein
MWQFFNELLPAMICREDAHLALISEYNNVTIPNMRSANKQETCSVVGFANEDPKKVPPYVGRYLLIEACEVLQMKIPRKYLHMWIQ